VFLVLSDNVETVVCSLILRLVIPVTGRGGTWGCETSRLPHFLRNRLIWRKGFQRSAPAPL
jgi:hypothetical protein